MLDLLLAPVRRVAAPNTPAPFSPPMERFYIPDAARIAAAAERAAAAGLEVLAGHGLNYINVSPIVRLPQIVELNIGHAIIARAVLVGLDRAVREMVGLLKAT